ncbi:MAG: type II toxin-antitoxin system RelE family toxin [Athalassotoga sp.]
MRCGEYRIIYEINEPKKEINILHIGPRRDVYR